MGRGNNGGLFSPSVLTGPLILLFFLPVWGGLLHLWHRGATIASVGLEPVFEKVEVLANSGEVVGSLVLTSPLQKTAGVVY